MQASGNTVLITGGASGIGLSLARLLIDSGNRVIVCGRDAGKLDAAIASLPGLIALRADITDKASRDALIRHVTEHFPQLNVLINNAGMLHVSDLTTPAHVSELEAEVAVNLMAPAALISGLLPTIRTQGSPVIVNITTGYVFLPSARTTPYSATKAALHVYTRGLRHQLERKGVHVVEVMPPAADTAMASHYAGSKVSPDWVATKILMGLGRGDQEIVLGISRWAQFLSRLMPSTAFAMMNRMEEKQATV